MTKPRFQSSILHKILSHVYLFKYHEVVNTILLIILYFKLNLDSLDRLWKKKIQE